MKRIALGLIAFLGLYSALSLPLGGSVTDTQTLSIGSLGASVPPATEWNRTYGGASSDEAYAVQQTIDGGYILAGTTGSIPGGDSNAWLVKTDAEGNPFWNQTYGGPYGDWGRALDQTADGGYVVAGTWQREHAITGEFDAWLVKTDNNGNLQWNQTYGGSANDIAASVQQTADGGYILGGVTYSFGNGSADFYLVKTDSAGNMEWSKTYGGASGDTACSAEQTADGGYILAGATASFGAGESDAWLVKTDMDGNVQWNKTYGGSRYDRANDVKQTADGGYVVAGFCRWTGEGYTGDFWLFKVDLNGDMQWSLRLNGGEDQQDEAYAVQQTADGGFAAAGCTSSVDGSGTDFRVIKADTEGRMQWDQTYGGQKYDEAQAIVQTSDGGYAIAGCTTSFGAGRTDFWLIKTLRANPPVASFTYSPTNPSVHEEITFNASASFDLDDDIVSYRWDFDDGNVSSREDSTIVHTFESPGTYNVTLTVTDSEGFNSSYSQILCVRIITAISISTSSVSTFAGFRVNVTGRLSDVDGNGLENETAVLYYAYAGTETWTPIASDITDNLGNYFVSWIPSAVGSFELKIEWVGNQTHFATSNVTSLEVLYITTTISISLSSSTSYVGFKVKINGNLTSDVGPLAKAPILLSYSVTKGQTWNDITLVDTVSDGGYSAIWMPPATGNYLVEASWNGNSTCLGASIRVDLAVIPFEDECVFSVTSNSTVSALAFDSEARELRFTVSGPAGTQGFIKVFIAKQLVADAENLEVKLNGEEAVYSVAAVDESWLVHLTYRHSVHTVTVNLGELEPYIGPFPSTLVWFLVAVASVLALTGIALFVLYRRAAAKPASAPVAPS